MVKSNAASMPNSDYGPRCLRGECDFPLHLGHCLPLFDPRCMPAYLLINYLFIHLCVPLVVEVFG